MDFTQRTEMLLGQEALEKLAKSTVAVFGLGGVGGASFEALVRMGVGTIHVIDADAFNESNLNRQILSTRENLGRLKVDVAEERAHSINPEAKIIKHPLFYLPENASQIPFEAFDFVIDAIDTVSAKVDIIQTCHRFGIPMVSCLGCGNRLDPSKLIRTDLFKTQGDPLAKVLRKKGRELGIDALPVVCSTEEPIKPQFKVESDSPTRRDVPGSASFVPPAAGYLLAYEAVRRLLEIA